MIKAKVYKARFRPFQATRYLNIAALKKAKKAVIEIGSIEAAGRSATLAAEIRNGAIVQIRPKPCRNCAKEKAPVKAHRAELKKVSLEALKRVRDRGLPVVRLPIRITSAQSLDFPDPGPIIILTWNNHGTICFPIVMPDGSICDFCLNGMTICIF